MRRFLYLSFFFPPCAGAESRHNVSQIRVLAENGYTAMVITAPESIDYPIDENLFRFVPEEIEIKRFPWPPTRNRYLDKIRRVGKLPENPLLFKGWRKIYRAAAAEASRHNYEFLYSVHGIAAAHLAAWRLKQDTGLKWVAEFRDPLIHNSIIWKYMKDHSWKWWYRREKKRTRAWQKRILTAADLIVVESPMHTELLCGDFGIEEKRIVPYGMGFDEDYYTEPADPIAGFPMKPVIGFIGSTYYGYDDALRNFVSALKKLEETHHQFTFVSVGDSSSRFLRFAQEIGLQSMVPIERVGYPQALALMKALDLGLVCVGQEYASNINSKIWEYLRANLSILGLVPNSGAMAGILREGQCGYLLPYDVDGMVQTLQKVLDDYHNSRLRRARPEFVARFSREQIGTKLAEKIEEMLCS